MQVAARVVRVVTGHAFVGSYSARFHPGKRTTGRAACSCPACGVNPQTVEHTIKVCPRYKGARTAHLSPIAHLSLPAVFGTKKGGRHSISSWRYQSLLQAIRGSSRPRIIFPGFSFYHTPPIVKPPLSFRSTCIPPFVQPLLYLTILMYLHYTGPYLDATAVCSGI